LPEYLYELAMFANGKYDDDQIDSTSQALAWTKQRPSGWGIREYYRREAERIRKPASSTRGQAQITNAGLESLYDWTGTAALHARQRVEIDSSTGRLSGSRGIWNVLPACGQERVASSRLSSKVPSGPARICRPLKRPLHAERD
jgi:hypothetical protein